MKKLDKDQRKRYQRMRHYGLTDETFQALLSRAAGRCQICNEVEPLQIDHNHATGKARGMLCRWCNNGLGFFRDNPEVIESAARYLRTTVEIERAPKVYLPRWEPEEMIKKRASIVAPYNERGSTYKRKYVRNVK